jgi:sugar transferase (PEP-CTERM/EpsH1 system associated)
VKILVLSHRIPFPPNKGEKIRTFHQIQFLASRGHEILVLSPYEEQEELAFAKELERSLGEHGLNVKALMFPLKAKWLRLAKGLATNQSLTVANFHNQSMQDAFDDLIDAGDCHAVICTSSAMSSFVFQNKALMNASNKPLIRLVMDFMDLDSDKWAQYESKATLPMRLVYGREKKLVNAVEKRSYQRFDECFFISENEVNLFAGQLAESSKLKVLGNGIDGAMFFPPKQGERSGQPVFLFTGVMNYKPNEDAVQWFVDSVWNDVKASWPQAEFVIAGMDPSPKIQQLAKKPGITVTGFVDDIVPYYQKADVFVAPFRLARGVQNKILQSLACGLAVVTTQLGLEGIKAEPEQEILIANNPESFFEAIQRLLTEEPLYRRLSENGPKFIQQHHSWDSVLQDLAAVLEGEVRS